MTEEEKKVMTREKHPGRLAQNHKLAALMKKRKEETLRSKEQSTEQPSVRSTVRSNDSYVYGVGILAVDAIDVCVFFAYNTSQAKKLVNEKQDQPPNEVICFRSDIYNKQVTVSDCDCQKNIKKPEPTVLMRGMGCS